MMPNTPNTQNLALAQANLLLDVVKAVMARDEESAERRAALATEVRQLTDEVRTMSSSVSTQTVDHQALIARLDQTLREMAQAQREFAVARAELATTVQIMQSQLDRAGYDAEGDRRLKSEQLQATRDVVIKILTVIGLVAGGIAGKAGYDAVSSPTAVEPQEPEVTP